MNLETGFLERNKQGEEVAQLHQDLLYLGYSIPKAELQGKTFGEGTHGAVLAFQNEHAQHTMGVVGEKTVEALNEEVKTRGQKPYVVKGRVQFANGKPVSKATIHAYHVKLRGKNSLGRRAVTPNESGLYSLEYNPKEYVGPGKLGINLQVEVHIPKRPEPEQSTIRYNAKPVEMVDFVVGGEDVRRPSEYELLVEKLRPFLTSISFAELEEKDIDFLHGRTGQPTDRIQFLIEAHKCRRKADLAAEVFYGFFRQGLPLEWHALLEITPELHQDALQSAIRENVIPTISDEELKKVGARLQSLRVDEALKDEDRNGKKSLIAFIRPTLRNRNLERAFFEIYLNHTGAPGDVLAKLRQKPALRAHVDAIADALELHRITLEHLPLFEEVQRLLRGRERRDLRSVRDLTQLNEEEWLKILRKPNVGVPAETPGNTPVEKRRNYGRILLENFEDTYPRDFFVNRLRREKSLNQKYFLTTNDQKHVLTFFQRNPGFDLKGQLLKHYLEKHPEALSGIPQREQKAVENKLFTVQRIYKLTSRYQPMMALLNDQLFSAHAISRLGRNTFLRRYAKPFGDIRGAEQTYEAAQDIHAKALVLASEFKHLSGVNPKVIVSEPLREEEVYPDWATLFGSLELCDCEHCQSVYSPAAYFVDMLHFLSDRSSKIPNKFVKDILFDRRPDLGDIELTCENTNLRLPYVDLVNEILENAVHPFKPFKKFTLSSDREADLNSATVTPELRQAFDLPLSEHAVITIGKKGRPWFSEDSWWTIDDLPFTYRIRKIGNGPITVESRGRQTTGTPAELAANPQYVNSQAYNKKLSRAEYPWTLPFDMWWEEARIYLGHLVVPRVQIMETFLKGERRDILENTTVAYEYLGITSHEARLITGGNQQFGIRRWRYWGFPAARLDSGNFLPDPADRTKPIESGIWITVLSGRVDVFLQQSGLTYQELLELLGTHYVNPVHPRTGRRGIQIESTDENRPATCETKSLKLEGFDVIASLKTMRFIRLWRRLGWSMRDVDRAITAYTGRSSLGTNGQLTDQFLIELSHIQRLHKDLGVPVIRLLSWWAPIDTVVYVDHSSPGQPKVLSLYAQLFRNRAVSNPLDPTFPEDPQKLEKQNISITDSAHLSTIVSALGISASEYMLLIHDENVITQKADPADPSRMVPDATLTLDFLSALHRHVALVKALKLSVQDYLIALNLIDPKPFPTTTTDTVLFVEAVNKIRKSPFSLEEFNYLLRHKVFASSKIAPDEEAIALALDEIRRGLQTIAKENTFSEDPTAPNGVTVDASGELTREKLALLNWDAALIDKVVETLNGDVVYETFLPSLPQNLVLQKQPIEDWGTIRYDHSTHRLLFTGLMTLKQWRHLTDLGGATRQFKDAIKVLFDQPRQFIARYLRSFSVHTRSFSTDLKSLPDGLQLPSALEKKIFFNSSKDPKKLHFIGVMTDAEREALLGFLFRVNKDFSGELNAGRFPQALRESFQAHGIHFPRPPRVATRTQGSEWQVEVGSTGYRMVKDGRRLNIYLLVNPEKPEHAPYRLAVGDLYGQPDKVVPGALDTFLTTSGPNNDRDAMFDEPTTPQTRFSRVLGKLLPYLRQTLSEQFVIQKISDALPLEVRVTDALLTKLVASPVDPQADPRLKRRALAELLAQSFITSHVDVELTSEAFPGPFRTYLLLQKIATVITKYEISKQELDYFFAQASTVGWLDLNSLPTDRQMPAASLSEWVRLDDYFSLRNGLSKGEQVLMDLFHLARSPGVSVGDLINYLVATTEWDRSDLEVLTGRTSFNFSIPDDFQDERALVRLQTCFKLLKRLGMSAKQCKELSAGNVDQDQARTVKQAVRAKYEESQWLNVAKPLRDVLREKQRSALVAYLTKHPDRPKNSPWRDANDLYSHFLVDVEMDPCRETSRLKQAISSTQLFVQRSLMNLEPSVAADSNVDDKWLQWKWMKQYRVWEANRKVFLYPESWIEPELRDNKSPFFKNLENELLQTDLTDDSAETALRHYLDNLDRVAHLEIVGMYHQLEGKEKKNILHVFGRTYATPHVYYYRQWVDEAYWTPWEEVDLDIEGNHLIPVVWQGRLYLFWPIFTSKADAGQMKMPNFGDDILPDLKKYWEIQLAWSEHKQGKWSSKKVSSNFLRFEQVHRLPREIGFLFNDEWIDYYEVNLAVTETFTFVSRIVEGSDDLDIITLLIIPEGVKTYADKFENTNFGFRFKGGTVVDPITTSVDLADVLNLERTLFVSLGDTKPYLQTLLHIGPIDPNGSVPARPIDVYLPVELSSSLISRSDKVLTNLKSRFRLVPPHNTAYGPHPFFFSDHRRSFFVFSRLFWDEILRYGFDIFCHPVIGAFVKKLNLEGLDGLLTREMQISPPIQNFNFQNEYHADSAFTLIGDIKENVEFGQWYAYSIYNWELFFHAPLFVADSLRKNQRYEQAQRWFHYIFNPTDTTGDQNNPDPKRYWQTKPFYKNEDATKHRIQNIITLLARGSNAAERNKLTPEELTDLREFELSVQEWRKHPFNPHLVARHRITAYQKTVVMKYLNMLIAWGDQLFRRDSIESLNEATQLYILALEILGERPETIPPRARGRTHTYNSLQDLDDFSNFWNTIEDYVPPSGGSESHVPILPTRTIEGGIEEGAPPEEERDVSLPGMLYFCVPKNEQLLEYWDIVDDRLFKIRHCRNIEGAVRQLPLFEPPIDPALLVKATAAGVDLTSVLNDINAALPHYRFNVMAQKATELCAELKSLGAALLSTLEKHDAEELGLLRAEHETLLLKSVEEVRKSQKEEAEQNLVVLRASRDLAVNRYLHYQNLLGVESPAVPAEGAEIPDCPTSEHVQIKEEGGIKTIPHEQEEIEKLEASQGEQEVAANHELAATLFYALPDIDIKPLGVGVTASFGKILSAMANRSRTRAGRLTLKGTLASKMAQYALRTHDWALQCNQASRDIMQIDKQIAAAKIREMIADHELKNHQKQIEQASKVETYLREKYTNQELYGWMLGRVSGVFFRTYQLTYDVAKRTERAYRHELGLQDSNFIQFGYWDSLKKGLLAGERLYHDLKRMEVAYLDQNRREYEKTKSISVLSLDAGALIRLRQTGECHVSLPESLFDLDHPGHYMRRIKSVSVTIPCVVGPHTSVNCTLTLVKSSVRHSNTLFGGKYMRAEETPDSRFTDYVGAIQSIVTSSAQNDSGLHEANLRDERYLPFEGAGVISEWRIELPDEFRQFDYDTISDVILHVRYTAREAGALFKEQASNEMQSALNEIAIEGNQKGLVRLFSVRHEFPNHWQSLLHPPANQAGFTTVTLPLAKERLPFVMQNHNPKLSSIELLAKVNPHPDFAAYTKDTVKLSLEPHAEPPNVNFRQLADLNGLLHAVIEAPVGNFGDWNLDAGVMDGGVKKPWHPKAIKDLWILCHYTLPEIP